MKFMLDTNICITLIRKQPPHLLKRLTTHRVGEIGISVITLSELQHGAAKSDSPEKNRAALEQFILPLEIADFDFAAAAAYGPIRAHLEKSGTPIGAMDFLIAAHALSLDATLVTNNVREFSRVPNLRVQDWTQP